MLTRAYYSNYILNFLQERENEILSELVRNHHFSLEGQQKSAWYKEIEILQNELKGYASGYILFEYSIPRMGKRADIILILKDLVFVIEFKINETQFKSNDINQCFDYALDLKYFHKESYDLKIIPILVATDAVTIPNTFECHDDGVFNPVKCNAVNLNNTVQMILQNYGTSSIDPIRWLNSIYRPTPTIIEAAQALYQGHSVKEISRSGADAENLSKTTASINKIIEKSKKNKVKSICFVTGVPGAGKTLAGLNLANERHGISEEEHTVFLSGNGPLVEVLQEALARNKVQHCIGTINKSVALRESKTFIQNIHHFRDEALKDKERPPIEKVVIFDEAQRAWDQKQTSSFMERKRNQINFLQSEPEFLISIMDRHHDWAVIICLIGGGQEINTGEAGLSEWFYAIKKQFRHWQVYVSDQVSDFEYTRNISLEDYFQGIKCEFDPDLHLKTSIRSFRSENVSKFVKYMLDCEIDKASKTYLDIGLKYDFVITRDLSKAKNWLKQKARASERYGIISSSKALRLKPYGIFVELKIDAPNWFLNSKDDVRSSYFLEYTATEFDIQGLELDWICVAWDADFRYVNRKWSYYRFRGKEWQKISNEDNRLFLKNTYRVLLTRARQGLIIFVPKGDYNDPTRVPLFYDETYDFLKGIGLREI